MADGDDERESLAVVDSAPLGPYYPIGSAW